MRALTLAEDRNGRCSTVPFSFEYGRLFQLTVNKNILMDYTNHCVMRNLESFLLPYPYMPDSCTPLYSYTREIFCRKEGTIVIILNLETM